MNEEIKQLLEADQARWIVVEGWLNFPKYILVRDGRVWSTFKYGRWLKSGKTKGYWRYSLQNHEGITPITRCKLLKLVFDNPPSEELIATGKRIMLRHINDVRDDDRLENLEWGTGKDNMDDRKKNGHCILPKGDKHWRSKHTTEQIKEFVDRYKAGENWDKLITEIGISAKNSWLIVTGRAWKHITGGPLTREGELSE